MAFRADRAAYRFYNGEDDDQENQRQAAPTKKSLLPYFETRGCTLSERWICLKLQMVHHENGAGPELSPNFGDGAAMKQTDTERLEKLAEAWR